MQSQQSAQQRPVCRNAQVITKWHSVAAQQRRQPNRWEGALSPHMMMTRSVTGTSSVTTARTRGTGITNRRKKQRRDNRVAGEPGKEEGRQAHTLLRPT